MKKRTGFYMTVVVLFALTSYFLIIPHAIHSAAFSFSKGSFIESKQIVWRLVDENPDLMRRGMQTVYDSHRQVVVMFGGTDNQDNPKDETWEYDGTSWQQVVTTHAPTPRFWHGMAFDSNRNVVVVFGGNDGLHALNDTWEYNGSDWTKAQTSHAPLWRQGFGMTYDSCRQKVVLFGGGETPTGTWEYNGVDWQEIPTSTIPGDRYLTAMAFDSIRCQTVLFGGDGGEAQGLNDTWEYDGTDWALISTVGSPVPRWAHALAYNPTTGKTVLFGGYGPQYPTGTPLQDTWEYDGTNWVQTSPANSPSAREQHVLAYEGHSKQILLFGGWAPGDTWLYGSLETVYLPVVMRNVYHCADTPILIFPANQTTKEHLYPERADKYYRPPYWLHRSITAQIFQTRSPLNGKP
jgi:hypothetical protein